MFAALADVLGSDVASEVKALGLPAGVASWNNCSVVERGAWSVERPPFFRLRNLIAPCSHRLPER